MVSVIHIIPHITPDFTSYGGPAGVFILIYQAVFIPAFSLPTSDTALFADRERLSAIRTLFLINQNRLTLPGPYHHFGHFPLLYLGFIYSLTSKRSSLHFSHAFLLFPAGSRRVLSANQRISSIILTKLLCIFSISGLTK